MSANKRMGVSASEANKLGTIHDTSENNVMKNIRHFRDLDVYQGAMALVMRIFELAKDFPGEERYALTDQVRRSSRSVCANRIPSLKSMPIRVFAHTPLRPHAVTRIRFPS